MFFLDNEQAEEGKNISKSHKVESAWKLMSSPCKEKEIPEALGIFILAKEGLIMFRLRTAWQITKLSSQQITRLRQGL